MTRRKLPEELKRQPADRKPTLTEVNHAADLAYFRAKYNAEHPDAPHVAALIAEWERGPDVDCQEVEESEEP